MQSPRGRRTTTPATSEVPEPPRAAAPTTQGDDHGGLVVPTSLGMYKKFNYTTRKMATYMLARMIIHSGVTHQDIEFEWITPRVLKVRIAWPEWFQNAEQMAMFCLNENGEMIYPPDHPLTMDTSARNQDLVEEDGRVWDDGVLCFDQDMKIDDEPEFELLNVDIQAQNCVLKVLQIFVQ